MKKNERIMSQEDKGAIMLVTDLNGDATFCLVQDKTKFTKNISEPVMEKVVVWTVNRILFRLGRNDEIRKEYLSTGY